LLTAILVVHSLYLFGARLRFPPLMVGRDLVQLRTLEGEPGVRSLNLRIPDMWSRLWANAFLLKIPQYFLTHTYEGRRNTPLKGEWDLNGDLVRIVADGAEAQRINDRFSIVRASDSSALRTEFGAGWYDLEGQPPGRQRWRWAKAAAAITFTNPQDRAVLVELTFTSVESATDREMALWLDGQLWQTGPVGPVAVSVPMKRFGIPAGASRTVELRSPAPFAAATGGDPRELVFRVFPIDVRVLP
jgi:hypothetical protein